MLEVCGGSSGGEACVAGHIRCLYVRGCPSFCQHENVMLSGLGLQEVQCRFQSMHLPKHYAQRQAPAFLLAPCKGRCSICIWGKTVAETMRLLLWWLMMLLMLLRLMTLVQWVWSLCICDMTGQVWLVLGMRFVLLSLLLLCWYCSPLMNIFNEAPRTA